MEIGAIIVAVLAAVGGFLVAFVGGKLDKLQAAVDRTPNKVDDAMLKLAKDIAGEIVNAKAEPPDTPLGTS